jgi:HEAT repeat protein
VDIIELIRDAAATFQQAPKTQRISIAIQCGALCSESFAQTSELPAELISLWKEALRDAEAEVRQAAVFGLYICTPPRVAVGEDSGPDRKREAWIVLARIGERDGIHWIAQQLQNDNQSVREAVAQELSKIDSKEFVAHSDMRFTLKDVSEIVRLEGARLLWEGENNTSETIPVLLKIMSNKMSKHRLSAARLLCRMGEQAAAVLPDLIALRNEEEWTLRLQAVRAIRKICPTNEELIPVLNVLSTDRNQFVAREARETLQELI